MVVLLLSLTMLFGASLVAYFVTRAQSQVWRTAEVPPMPSGLLVSTALLLALSLGIHYAKARLGKNDFPGLKRGLFLVLGLGVLFLGMQVGNWRTVATADLAAAEKSLYAYTFYMLTALHALHVIGGVLASTWVTQRALRGDYSSSRSEGVHLLGQYWDFLLVVWVVLLGALWIGR